MSDDQVSALLRATRRSVMGGASLFAASGLAVSGAAARAVAAPPPTMTAKPSGPETRTRTALHQEVAFSASPARIYDALLSSEAFAKFSGMAAKIDPQVGGAISMFGGLVVGRNVELVPKARIVQAWRLTEEWPAGVYSMVNIALAPTGSGTLLILDHTGFPEGNYDHLFEGWAPRYWTPLKAYLA